MSRRRTTRLSTTLDASFQIPLVVNSTSNDLLLEDESLEQDFFDGFEYTLTTPVSKKSPSSNLTTPVSKSRRAAWEFTDSDRENSDYDYAQEEREMANTEVEEETPRARVAQYPVFSELSPTPRSRPNMLNSTASIPASRPPTSVSRTPVRRDDFVAMNQGNDSQSSSAKQPRSSASPSITPKPKRSRPRTSQATPSGLSVRTGAAVPSQIPRSPKGPLQLRPEEAGTNMLRHQHESSTLFSSPFPSGSALSEQDHLNRITPTPNKERSRSPHSPERTFDILIYAGAQHPNTMRKRRPRSNTRSTSPSGLSRIRYDAVMLPIQEEDEDLQARDNRPSISKPRRSPDFVPNEMASQVPLDQNNLVAHTDKKSSRRSVAGNSRPKAMLPQNSSVKRGGDSLATQPALKKRKTEVVKTINRGTDSGLHQTPLPCSNPSVPTLARPLPERVHEDDCKPDMPSPETKPVTPDSNHRLPLSPISQLLIELRSENPSGISNTDHVLPGDNHGRDEVHDFLLHIAKKYGGGGGGGSSTISVGQEKPVTARSNDRNVKSQISAVSQQSSVLPEKPAPKGNPSQPKVGQPSNLSIGNDSASLRLKTGVRRVSIGRNKLKKRRSASGMRNVPESIADEPGISSEGVSGDLQTAIQASQATIPDIDSEVPLSPRGASTSVLLPEKRPGIGHSDRMDTSSWDLIEEEEQGISPQAVQSSLPVPVVPSETVQPECLREESEPRTRGEVTEPAVTVERSTEIAPSPRRPRPVNGKPPKRPSTLSTQPASKTTRNPQPRSDDMFARKKRDNYLQRGLDLTPYSSRRFAAKISSAGVVRNASPKALSRELPKDIGKVVVNESLHATVSEHPRSVTAVLDLTSDAEDQTLQHSAHPNAELIIGNTTHRPVSSKTRGKKTVKPDTEKPSDRTSKKKASQSDSGVGIAEQSTSEPNDEVSATSMTERFLHVGQKIIGSLGLLPSQSGGAQGEISQRTVALHSPDFVRGHRVMEAIRGSVVDNTSPTTNATDQIHSAQHRMEGAKSDNAESDGHVHASEFHGKVQQLRRSQKRAFPDAWNIEKDEAREDEQARKRVRLSREDTITAGSEVLSEPSRPDKLRNTITSQMNSIKGEATRGLLVNRKTKAMKTRATPHSSETSSSGKTVNGASGVGPAKSYYRLTVPVAPAFTTDKLHQKRAIARSEREAQHQGNAGGRKTGLSDDRAPGNCAKAKAPVSDTLTRETRKPTVPHVFRFETDGRLANRRQEFEAKLKLWERRASEASNSNEQGTNMSSRHRKQITPTIPVSPHFAVDIRLAQRHKFDDAQRAKEQEAERIREEQRRAREEEEEREWREARKRTVPRANHIPEWYSQAPRRTATNR